jgi:hypothetical protein
MIPNRQQPTGSEYLNLNSRPLLGTSFFRSPRQLPVSIGDSEHKPFRVLIDHLLGCDASVCGAVMPKFWIIQN